MKPPFRGTQGEAVIFSLPLKGPCPCDSGKRLKRCCWDGNIGRFHKRPATVMPPGPRTGQSVTGCYAVSLQDCGGRLTREHYVSAGILRRINSAGDMRVTNFPVFSRGETKRLGPNALTAHILCERHNNALSLFDTEASRFFAAVDDMAAEFRNSQSTPVHRLHLFSGHDLERWLLKVLAGFAVFGEKLFPDHPTNVDLSPAWIEILFCLRSFGPGEGLYSPRTTGKGIPIERGVALGAVGRQGKLVGLSAVIEGYLFHLIMAPKSERDRTFLGDSQVYRPFELHVTDGISEKSIVLSWDGPSDSGTIHLANRNLPDTVDPRRPKGK